MARKRAGSSCAAAIAASSFPDAAFESPANFTYPPKGKAAIDWGVYGIPETFVVDRKGVIVHKHIGPISEAALKATFLPEVEKALTR